MTPKKKKGQVIAVCIQEPFEDGSSMDFGAIQGDDLRYLHQAFITDTLINALKVEDTDIRLYYIGSAERNKLVKIVTDYVKKKAQAITAADLKSRLKLCEMSKERWGIRVEKVFEDCFGSGYNSVLVIGSRTPTVSREKMETALQLLKKSDAVFGPTPDGRYYVIGLSNSYRIRLSEFDWKSPSIYSEVARTLEDKGLVWSELEIWYAVETPDYLEVMVRDINQFRFEGDESTAHETELVMERLLSKLEN
jgi:glycosyltransferase A (GT-A) superfamily protein (DUF2064 family)